MLLVVSVTGRAHDGPLRAVPLTICSRQCQLIKEASPMSVATLRARRICDAKEIMGAMRRGERGGTGTGVSD